MKYLKTEEVYNKLNKISKDEFIKVLYGALNLMEAYNGRTQQYCIFRAFGYENNEGEFDKWFKL